MRECMPVRLSVQEWEGMPEPPGGEVATNKPSEPAQSRRMLGTVRDRSERPRRYTRRRRHNSTSTDEALALRSPNANVTPPITWR